MRSCRCRGSGGVGFNKNADGKDGKELEECGVGVDKLLEIELWLEEDVEKAAKGLGSAWIREMSWESWIAVWRAVVMAFCEMDEDDEREG